jgi:hypothetical protein
VAGKLLSIKVYDHVIITGDQKFFKIYDSYFLLVRSPSNPYVAYCLLQVSTLRGLQPIFRASSFPKSNGFFFMAMSMATLPLRLGGSFLCSVRRYSTSSATFIFGFTALLGWIPCLYRYACRVFSFKSGSVFSISQA